MRHLLSLLVMIASLQYTRAQDSNSSVIPDHTAVEIELQQDISSESLHEGEALAFKIIRPVVVQNVTVLAQGTSVWGEVKTVKVAGSWRRAGSFDLTLKPLQMENGTVVQLDFPHPQVRSAKAEKAGSAVGTGLLMTYYFPLIPVALIGAAKKGKPYEIRAGERYLVYVVSTDKAESGSRSPMEPSKR